MAARQAGGHESYSNQGYGHGATHQSRPHHAPRLGRNIRIEHWSIACHIRASGTVVGSSSARSKQADYLLWPQFYGTWREYRFRRIIKALNTLPRPAEDGTCSEMVLQLQNVSGRLWERAAVDNGSGP